MTAIAKDSEKAHSEIGASSLYRWSKCPGSVSISKGIPPKTSQWAEEGTVAHDAAASLLIKGRLPDEFQSGNFLSKYPDMIAAVTEYVDLIRTEWNDDKSEHDQILIEHRFHLSQIHVDAFGTADCVMYKHNQKKLKVFDYKHGQGHVVDVKSNPQLYYYALGAVLSLPQIKPKIIESIIVQPRAYHEDGTVRREEYTRLDLLEFASDLKRYIGETEKPNAPINPGEWCHFCPAKPQCPALHEKALEAAKSEFQPVGNTMKPIALAKAMEILPAVEAWVKAIREFAYNEAEAGRCPPGYKLVAKKALRKWIDEGQVANYIQRHFTPAIAQECFTEPKLISVAQVEKVMGKKDFIQFSEFVTAISSGTTLVEESDKRPAILPGNEFMEIKESNLLA